MKALTISMNGGEPRPIGAADHRTAGCLWDR